MDYTITILILAPQPLPTPARLSYIPPEPYQRGFSMPILAPFAAKLTIDLAVFAPIGSATNITLPNHLVPNQIMEY